MGTEEWLERQAKFKKVFEEVPQTCEVVWYEASGGE
jgi:hypothetical protein